MNYRHSYHAGGACDVVKHTLLVGVLSAFQNKKKPFGVIDTHAGSGLYYLESIESSKTGEYEQGIKQVWKNAPKHPMLQAYLKMIQSFNADGNLKYYPGSPLIIERFLGEGDRLTCAELHPEDGKVLKETLSYQKQVSVHIQNGYLAPKAFLPFAQKRGIVLMDPPFEEKNDFDRMIVSLKEGVKKTPQGTFMFWYPLKNEDQQATFYEALIDMNLPNIVKTEFYFYKRQETGRLNGTGMVLVNLPWGLEEEIRHVFSELNAVLAFESGAKWIVDSLSIN
jgi:23S rRNA (adenine2030-N6)-methyltransferase